MFGEGAEGQELEVTLNGERVKLYMLEEVPMFFMQAKRGATPPPPRPLTDPNEERVKMMPDIHLEFPEGKGRAADHRRGVSRSELRGERGLVHRPMSSTKECQYRDAVRVFDRAAIGLCGRDGSDNATGPGDTPSRRKIFVCQPKAQSEEVACARQILTNLTRRAYRRASTDADLEPLLSFYQQGRNATGNFESGIEMALRRILADPEFVFRFEPPPATVAPGGAYRINDVELASRLSFFIWSSIPDDELLNLAIQNKLHEPAVLERETRRMLADARAHALVTNFAGQWLYLRELKNANPDPREFPDFDDNLRQAFQRETEMLFESVVREDRPVLDLLNADYTFVNERLAKHYGMAGIYGPDFRRTPVPPGNPEMDARRGLLGQGSMPLVTSNANRTPPVQRGKWVLENLLGSPLSPPPPNVPPLKENTSGAALTSVRERIEEHRSNPVCAACHKIMDPIGLALENFDGTGAWRTVDSGFKVDPSGQLVDGTPLSGPASLRQALSNRPEAFVGNMTEKLLMYGTGRESKYYDMPVVRAVMRDAAKDQYRFSGLVLGIVKSAPFQMKMKEATVKESQVRASR